MALKEIIVLLQLCNTLPFLKVLPAPVERSYGKRETKAACKYQVWTAHQTLCNNICSCFLFTSSPCSLQETLFLKMNKRMAKCPDHFRNEPSKV